MRVKPKLSDFGNVAILQTAFLGDVIISLSFASAVKRLNPKANLIFITTPQAAPLARICRDIDFTLAFDKRGKHGGVSGAKIFSDEAREYKIDCAISLHKSLRSTLLIKKIGAKFAVGFSDAAASFLYDAVAPRKRHLHESRRNFEALKAFEIERMPDWKRTKPGFAFSREIVDSTDAIVSQYGKKKLVVIAPGSVWETKRWGTERFAALANELVKLGYGVAVMGGEGEKDLCGQVVELAPGAVSFAGKLSLERSLALIGRSALIVANDSAPTHMANAIGTPAITVFGATSSIFGFYPYGRNDSILENYDLRCHPCRIHGGRRCPIGTLECMKSVGVQQALAAANKILKL
ncbi:MAG: glycosyltransferase family 9 protein [Chloroflexota bacterium]